jgi:hypothetical protein
MRRIIAAAFARLLLLLVLLVPCAAKSTGDAVIEVPFTLEKGHIIVPAKIKGDKPVEVVLSTGTEHSLVNALLLEKYKLQAYYTGVGVITGHNDRTITFANVPDIRVGELKGTSLSMLFGAQTLTTLGERVGREIFAILGADFFKGRIVQFDFQKKVVRFLLESPAVTKDSPGGSHTVERAVLPFRYNADVLTLPIVEDVTFNGKRVKTLLDTGALTVVSFTPSAAKQIGLEAPTEKSAPSGMKVGSLRIGEIEFNDVPVTIEPKVANSDQDSHGIGAIAGIALLQNFVATFDFHQKVVILERR